MRTCGLALQCPDLKRLKLCNDEAIECDNTLQYLTGICDKLESIELLEAFPMTSEDFVWLGACNELVSITIPAKSLPSVEDIKVLLKNKKRLKTYIMKKVCDSQVLSELGMNCPSLELSHIYCAKNPIAAHIEAFVQGCTKLKLKTLLIYDIVTDDKVSSMFFKDKLIEGLGKNCPLLENLIVFSKSDATVTNISEAAMKSLAQGCPLLKSWSMNYATVSAQGMKYLADHCNVLDDIDFSYSAISDDVLVEIGKIKSLKFVSTCRV